MTVDTSLSQRICASRAKFLLAIAFAVISLNASVFAQDVSLLADDTIDDIRITLPQNGGEFVITVIRDAYNPNQWYYIPKHPRVVEVMNNGKLEPVFHLFRYQIPDPNDRSKLLEGGLLQFSATLAIPDAAVEPLKATIANRKGLNKAQITLTGLRIRSADVTVYTPGGVGGTFVATPVFGVGAAPTFANQDMSFSMDLTKGGAELFRSLMDGTTGVQLIVTMKYGGLTPPAGFSVTVDYAQARDYYSNNTTFAARASYFGLFGASYESNSSQIRDTLVNSGALKIDIVQGSGFTEQDADKYLQPIVKRINDEILQTFQPPREISPAVANAVKAGGYFGSAGYSVATKQESQLKQLKETINFRVRRWEERVTPVTGFVSVGIYPADIRAKLVSFVQSLNWESAYYILPPVDTSPELNMSGIDLTIGLKSNNKVIPDQIASWRPATGWRDREGKAVTTLTFNLAAAGFTADVLKNAVYTSQMNVTAGPQNARRTIIITRTEPAFQGERALTTPSNYYDVLKLDGHRLSFIDLDPSSDLKLQEVTGSITVGEGASRTTFPVDLAPPTTSNPTRPPEPVYIIVPKTASGDPGPVIANLQFEFSTGNAPWKGNGDLRTQFPGLLVNLKDYMVKEAKAAVGPNPR